MDNTYLMISIPYYQDWWRNWVDLKVKGEKEMSETTEFCCPHCGRNEEISENVGVLAEYIGRFDKDGIHYMNEGQTVIIGDSIDGIEVFYFCYDCGKRFDEPITVDEFNDQLKEEKIDGE